VSIALETQHPLGGVAEQTAGGQRDRGDAIRLSTRRKPSKGACVTGMSPWTDAVFRHRARPRGEQRGEPHVRHRAAICSEPGTGTNRRGGERPRGRSVGGGVATDVPMAQRLRLPLLDRRAGVRETEEGRAHPGGTARYGGSQPLFLRTMRGDPVDRTSRPSR